MCGRPSPVEPTVVTYYGTQNGSQKAKDFVRRTEHSTMYYELLQACGYIWLLYSRRRLLLDSTYTLAAEYRTTIVGRSIARASPVYLGQMACRTRGFSVPARSPAQVLP